MKKIGIRFNDIDKIKTQSIKLDPAAAEMLGLNNNAKAPIDYIKMYLNDSSLFENINDQFINYVEKTLPDNIRQKCKWCLGEKEDENNKICNMYYREAEMNFFFASYEFVSIVEKNKNLIKGDALLKSLTIKFFECFAFQDGRVWFDLEKITMYCLKAGFMTLSQLFAKNSTLQNLSIINEAMQEIDSEQLEVEMFGKKPPIYLEPQKKFFESKQKYFKEKHFIERETEPLIKTNEANPDEVSNKIGNHYSHIFKNNAFEVWQSMYDSFGINKSSRTDVKFMFEEMKKDGLIFETVNQTTFLDWISQTYEITITKTSNHSRTKERISIYSNAKQLYSTLDS